MSKPVFPKDLLSEEFFGENKKWVEEYKRETKLDKGYYQKLEKFFKFIPYQNKSYNTFQRVDVEKYIEVMLDNNFSLDTINTLVGALSGYRNYLVETHKEIFSKEFLADLSELRFDDTSPSDVEPLNLIQLCCVREYNKDDFNDEYIFEIYFQLGVKKKDITFCRPSNKNEDKKCFDFKKKESIAYNSKIVELLEKAKNNNELKLEIGTVNSYLIRVTRYLKNQGVYHKERLLSYSDISASREAYIFKCPNCRSAFENISTNWVLAKIEFDDQYRLVCTQCKGAPNGN